LIEQCSGPLAGALVAAFSSSWFTFFGVLTTSGPQRDDDIVDCDAVGTIAFAGFSTNRFLFDSIVTCVAVLRFNSTLLLTAISSTLLRAHRSSAASVL